MEEDEEDEEVVDELEEEEEKRRRFEEGRPREAGRGGGGVPPEGPLEGTFAEALVTHLRLTSVALEPKTQGRCLESPPHSAVHRRVLAV